MRELAMSLGLLGVLRGLSEKSRLQLLIEVEGEPGDAVTSSRGRDQCWRKVVHPEGQDVLGSGRHTPQRKAMA